MDPERQQLLRPNQQPCEQVKIVYGADSIVFPSSLQGRVPPDRFYHTMKRLNEAYGPLSGRTKVFIITLILLFIGLLMPFAMMRWFTPRHFEVKVWIPIDGILIAVNLGLALLMYIRSRRIRSELAKIVKKENKVCYHKTGVHLRLEPGGIATRPAIYIELAQTAASDHAAYGSHQAPHSAPLPARHGPGRVPPPSKLPDSRLPSPPPFRQQHSFYELQQQHAPPTPQQQAMPRQEFRSPPMSPRGGSGSQHRQPDQRQPSPPMPLRGGDQPRQPDQRQPSPPMSPRYHQHGGAPPPSNYAPPPISSPPVSSYRPQVPSDGGAFHLGSPQTGHLAVEFTSVPVRDPPSQGQYYDPTEGHYSPSPSPLPQKRSAAGFNPGPPTPTPPYSPSRQQSPPPHHQQQQQQYYKRQQQQQQPFYPPQGGAPPRQAASPRQGGPYGNQPHTAHRAI